MRTKTTVMAAGFVAAGALSSMAQNVYSVNVVGYVNVVINPGFNLIANPLNAPDNSLSGLFAYNLTNVGPFGGGNSPADSDVVYFFNGSSFSPVQQPDNYGDSGWATNQFPPGVGFFYLHQHDNNSFTNTFVGTVPQGVLSNNIPSGFSLVSSQVPQAGFIGNLGFNAGPNAGAGDVIYMFNGASFTPLQNDNYGNGWQPPYSGFNVDVTNGPFLNVAQSLFYLRQNAGSIPYVAPTWVRNFTVQ